MGKMRQFCTLFVFTALMFVKVSAFHVYTHDDAEEDTVDNCALCDMAMDIQQSVTFVPTPISISTIDTFVYLSESPLIQHQVANVNDIHCHSILSRPPPSM
ncbi:MAG: hypothetical protein AAFO99_01860 [Bacteroidota bacterium]